MACARGVPGTCPLLGKQPLAAQRLQAQEPAAPGGVRGGRGPQGWAPPGLAARRPDTRLVAGPGPQLEPGSAGPVVLISGAARRPARAGAPGTAGPHRPPAAQTPDVPRAGWEGLLAPRRAEGRESTRAGGPGLVTAALAARPGLCWHIPQLSPGHLFPESLSEPVITQHPAARAAGLEPQENRAKVLCERACSGARRAPPRSVSGFDFCSLLASSSSHARCDFSLPGAKATSLVLLLAAQLPLFFPRTVNLGMVKGWLSSDLARGDGQGQQVPAGGHRGPGGLVHAAP